MKQGTEEWHAARRGKATSSRFKDCLNSGKGFTQTNLSYIYELVAENLTGETKQVSARAIDHGNEWEWFVREYIEKARGVEVWEVGFSPLPSDDRIGGSPDGIVGKNETIVEIKCPYNSAVHVKTLVTGEMPFEHMAQVQGNMWVTGAANAIFASFDPRVDSRNNLVLIDVPRDDEYIEMLKEKVTAVADEVSRLTEIALQRAAGSVLIGEINH